VAEPAPVPTVDVAPYDAFLLVSFGGPEGPDDVLPFLENVTRGKNIPRERLIEVGQHYVGFGGVSPINAQNRELIAAIEHDFAAHGLDLPVYWGNRNWDPYLTDTVQRLADDGRRRVLALLTSAYSSYSGCRQYRENLADAVAAAGPRAPQIDRLRHYFNTPGFVAASVRAALAAYDQLDPAVRDAARLVFVTHSIPTSMNDRSGPAGGAYLAQHQDVARSVARAVTAAARASGTAAEPADLESADSGHDLVFCSRSGPPSQPWLEPDVNDHLEALAGAGVPAVVLVPIGFVSDHMEVRFDLDTEAAATAERLGLGFARAATAGTDPEFVEAIRRLVVERAATSRGEPVDRAAVGRLGPSHDVCPATCCPNLRDPERPALCGGDRGTVVSHGLGRPINP
jgi:protoporphyrin/coproporphyrin ferrochelatase